MIHVMAERHPMEWLRPFIESIKNILTSDNLYSGILLKSLTALVGSVVIWMVLKLILNVIEKRIKQSEFIKKNTQTFPLIRKFTFYTLILVTGSYLIGLFDGKWIGNIFYAAFIMLLAVPVKDFIMVAVRYVEARIAKNSQTKIDDIIFDILNKFTGTIIYATAVIFALDILGINIMPIIAGAGIAGVAIGFASKDTLSNLIAGILLIIDRPFELGDRIELWQAPKGSATWGDVIDIGLRATKIRTTDNIVVIIPNNEIMIRDIINYTTINSKIRVRINIGVAYDSDMEKAKEAILKVARQVEWISDEPEPKVVVRNFGAFAVELQLRIWIQDARKRMDTISFITDKVKSIFEIEGIEIPYPKRDLYIKKESDAAGK